MYATPPAMLHCQHIIVVHGSSLLAPFQLTLNATQQLVAQSCSTAVNYIPTAFSSKQLPFRKWPANG